MENQAERYNNSVPLFITDVASISSKCTRQRTADSGRAVVVRSKTFFFRGINPPYASKISVRAPSKSYAVARRGATTTPSMLLFLLLLLELLLMLILLLRLLLLVMQQLLRLLLLLKEGEDGLRVQPRKRLRQTTDRGRNTRRRGGRRRILRSRRCSVRRTGKRWHRLLLNILLRLWLLLLVVMVGGDPRLLLLHLPLQHLEQIVGAGRHGTGERGDRAHLGGRRRVAAWRAASSAEGLTLEVRRGHGVGGSTTCRRADGCRLRLEEVLHQLRKKRVLLSDRRCWRY